MRQENGANAGQRHQPKNFTKELLCDAPTRRAKRMTNCQLLAAADKLRQQQIQHVEGHERHDAECGRCDGIKKRPRPPHNALVQGQKNGRRIRVHVIMRLATILVVDHGQFPARVFQADIWLQPRDHFHEAGATPDLILCQEADIEDPRHKKIELAKRGCEVRRENTDNRRGQAVQGEALPHNRRITMKPRLPGAIV